VRVGLRNPHLAQWHGPEPENAAGWLRQWRAVAEVNCSRISHRARSLEPIAMDVLETTQWRSGAADPGGFQKMEVRIAVL
jgi:hypothetical protein